MERHGTAIDIGKNTVDTVTFGRLSTGKEAIHDEARNSQVLVNVVSSKR